jgi:serine/threonine protein phosphatase PrpC
VQVRAFLNELLIDREPFLPGWLDGLVYTSRCPVDKKHNEDCAGYYHSDDFAVVLVADGLGGHKGGGQASRLVVETIQACIEQWEKKPKKERSSRREMLMEAIELSHRRIHDLGLEAGTTLTMAEVMPNTIRFYNIGDSCSLLMTERGFIKYRNVEHSPVGYCLEAGVMKESEVIGHPASGVVLNALGIEPFHVEISQELELKPEDMVLLASDGLTDNVLAGQISDDLRRGDLGEKVSRLSHAAHSQMSQKKGKPDDLTIVLFRLADELKGN